MTGYQEVITDPSFAGQIVTMTCPHIGNVGVNPDDMESVAPALRGLLVRDYCDVPSNWRARGSLSGFLRQRGIPALTGLTPAPSPAACAAAASCAASSPPNAARRKALIRRAQAVPDMSAVDCGPGDNAPTACGLDRRPDRTSPCWTAAPRPTSPPVWPPVAAG